MTYRGVLSLLACLCLALGAAACGDDEEGSPTSTQSGASGATGSTGAAGSESTEAATAEERAADYADCLRAAGVNGVEESKSFPQVSFPAGSYDLLASFLETPKDAARAAKPQSPSLYGESFGSTALRTDAGYSDVVEGPPPKADRRLALDCLTEIGA